MLARQVAARREPAGIFVDRRAGSSLNPETWLHCLIHCSVNRHWHGPCSGSDVNVMHANHRWMSIRSGRSRNVFATSLQKTAAHDGPQTDC
jgi:hypothetical protein